MEFFVAVVGDDPEELGIAIWTSDILGWTAARGVQEKRLWQPTPEQIEDGLRNPAHFSLPWPVRSCWWKKKGLKMAHSASVKSVGKANPLRAWRARVISVHIVGPKVVFGETPESTTGQAVKITR